MVRSNFLIERYNTADAKQQQELQDHVLGVAAEGAISKQEQFVFEPMFEWLDEINERYKSWGKMVGLETGYWPINSMTMGLAPGELIVVGGATSNGKTALCINIAANLAIEGKTVLFVTLEMTQAELGSRFKKIMGDKFEDGMANILFQKTDELNWQSIDGLMKRAKEDANADLVIIDHLHYFTRNLQNVAEELGNITKEFKKNAIRHSLPVLLISHTRKGNDSNTTKTGINDLRGSSYIAQDADIVLMVERDRDYPSKILVRLEKNRNRYGVKIGSDYMFDFIETKILNPSPNPKFYQ